jgi:hypothetical protein
LIRTKSIEHLSLYALLFLNFFWGLGLGVKFYPTNQGFCSVESESSTDGQKAVRTARMQFENLVVHAWKTRAGI